MTSAQGTTMPSPDNTTRLTALFTRVDAQAFTNQTLTSTMNNLIAGHVAFEAQTDYNKAVNTPLPRSPSVDKNLKPLYEQHLELIKEIKESGIEIFRVNLIKPSSQDKEGQTDADIILPFHHTTTEYYGLSAKAHHQRSQAYARSLKGGIRMAPKIVWRARGLGFKRGEVRWFVAGEWGGDEEGEDEGDGAEGGAAE